mmetsp:Transcript_28760/g.66392  ORF Transcript_28760/g.66392 Transcript_28760/m.66392 type:complete len:201 (+) Transcript_28760:96-698(+)
MPSALRLAAWAAAAAASPPTLSVMRSTLPVTASDARASPASARFSSVSSRRTSRWTLRSVTSSSLRASSRESCLRSATCSLAVLDIAPSLDSTFLVKARCSSSSASSSMVLSACCCPSFIARRLAWLASWISSLTPSTCLSSDMRRSFRATCASSSLEDLRDASLCRFTPSRNSPSMAAWWASLERCLASSLVKAASLLS